MMNYLINLTKESQYYNILGEKFENHFSKTKLWCDVQLKLDDSGDLDSESENRDLDSNGAEENDDINSTSSSDIEEETGQKSHNFSKNIYSNTTENRDTSLNIAYEVDEKMHVTLSGEGSSS